MSDTLNKIKANGDDKSMSTELNTTSVEKPKLKVMTRYKRKRRRLPKPNVRKTHNFDNKSELGTVREVECLLRTQNNFSDQSMRSTEEDLPKSKFADYYENLTGLAKYLNFEQLAKAQEFDPFWKVIRNDVKNKGEQSFQNKMFFLYKDVLYCKEQYKGLFIYKVIIPDLISHDLVSQSHRHFNCVKGKKLYKQLYVSFEIRNLRELVNRTVRECFS